MVKKRIVTLLLTLIISCAYSQDNFYFLSEYSNNFYKMKAGVVETFSFFEERAAITFSAFCQKDKIVYIKEQGLFTNGYICLYDIKTSRVENVFECKKAFAPAYASEKYLYMLEIINESKDCQIVSYDLSNGVRNIVSTIPANLITCNSKNTIKTFWLDEATKTIFVNRKKLSDWQKKEEPDFVIVSFRDAKTLYLNNGEIILPNSCTKFKNIYFAYQGKIFSLDLSSLKKDEIQIKGKPKKLDSYTPCFFLADGNKNVIAFQQRKESLIAKLLFGTGYYYKRTNYTFDFDDNAIVLKEKLALDEKSKLRDLR